MIKITKNELREMLMTSAGANIITIISATNPKIVKGAPFKNLEKISRVNGIINFRYASSVTRQREREGIQEKFVSENRKWGYHIGGGVIQYNQNYYLEMKVERSIGHTYVDGNEILTDDRVKPFLIPSSKSAKQGIEKQVILRDYKFESIRGLTFHGKEFSIV